MSNAWDKAKETAESHKGGGLYVRLENDGDKIVGVFCGDPFTREVFWNDKAEKFEDFTPEHKAAGKKSSAKFKMNFFVLESKEMKIFELNIMTFKDVLKVKEKYGLENWAFEVSRSGKKDDTKTTYAILPEEKLSTELRETISKAELHDLSKKGDEAADSKTDMNSHDKKNGAANGAGKAASNEAISAEKSTALVGRLKLLPKEKIDKFLAKFGIAKVKELKGKDETSAFAFVDELEGKKADEKPPEADPFAD